MLAVSTQQQKLRGVSASKCTAAAADSLLQGMKSSMSVCEKQRGERKETALTELETKAAAAAADGEQKHVSVH